MRHAVAGLGVAHAADDHRAAKVLHRRADAQLPPRGGKTAVRRHQQRRLQGAGGAIGVGVVQRGMAGGDGHPLHLGAGDEAYAGQLRGDGPGAAAQGMVGHDPAQCLAATAAGIQRQRGVLAHGAVVHLCAVDASNLLWCQCGPTAQAAQRVGAGVGECDFAAIGRRVGQRGCRLLLHHRGPQARLRQRDGQ